MSGVAQGRDEFLVIGHAVFIHRQHDDRAGAWRLATMGLLMARKRREQPRHADGEAGRGDRLGAEAGDEAVITPAAADRAEADGTAVLVLDLEGEFGLEDGAGVVFEAADDGGVDHEFDPSRITGRCERCNLPILRSSRMPALPSTGSCQLCDRSVNISEQSILCDSDVCCHRHHDRSCSYRSTPI